MKGLSARNSFKKDLERIGKRGYDRVLLDETITALRRGDTLPAARRDHTLKGDWKGWRECHIEPDWLLVYRTDEEVVYLARTGTHADPFGT